MNLNQAFPSNPQEISSASIASASPPQPPIPKRRHSQRIYLKDRPQSIYQLQLSEIQALNQQLQSYKRQKYPQQSIQPASPIPHSNQYRVRWRENQNQVQLHRAPHQGIATVVRAGEQYREQILAASELRNDEEKQKFNILRHIEALARERESLLSQIVNQKAKSSLLEQELFLNKDSTAKQMMKVEVQRNELLGEIKGLQISCGKLEGALREANSQVAVIPLYEQRCLEKEGTISLLTQQLNQARTELAYFVEKSKYFENNHTVLNENFNSLYISNLSLSSELKELQRRYSLSEEQLKEMNKKVIILKEEKDKMLYELNLDIKEIIIKKRAKFEASSSSDPSKSEESLMLSLEQLKNFINQQENRLENLQKQINNKENIILLEKSISERFKINLKDLEEDWKKKEQQWREASSKEISSINKDFTAKILQLEAKNMRTKEEATKVEQSLKALQQEISSTKRRQFQLSNQLQASISKSQAKEEVIRTLKNELEHSKLAENLNKNSINDYERKLNTSLTVQEQLSLSTRANLDQKHLKIRQLEDKLTLSREELVRLQVRLHSLEQDLTRTALVNEQLKSELDHSFTAKQQLERAFVNQAGELGRAQQETSLKENIIDKYCNVTEEMTEKIVCSQRQIQELKQKCSKLLEQNELSKIKNQKLQHAFKQASGTSQTKQKQNISLQEKVISLQNSLKQYAKNSLEMDFIIQTTKQKLREKERQTLTAEITLKQAIKTFNMERDKQIASIILQTSQKIEAITSEKVALENEYKKLLAENKTTIESMRNSLESLSSKKSQGELKIAQQRKIISQNEISLIQHSQNLAKTHSLLIQTKQKSKKQAEQHLKQKEYLSQAIKQLQSECQQHKEQKKIKILLLADSQTKREQELKVNKQTLTEIAQMLSNEKAKCQILELEKSLLVKSLKQIQQTFSSQLEVELTQKSQTQRQLIDQKQEEIAFITTQKNSLKNELDSLRLKNFENESMIAKLQTIIQRNHEVHKCQVQFLKKANLQLQAECSRFLHSSQSRSQIVASTSRLEMKNSFLEQTLARTLNEIESMQPLFGEVKQERDQLIKKYILLSNQISGLKNQRSGLENELDAFAQYFSRISALYTQIGRHFYNISQLSQSTSFRVIHSVLPLTEQPNK